MPLAYVYGGGQITFFLFWMYILYSIVSFVFHMYPSRNARIVHLVLFNLFISERGYLKTGNIWVYFLSLCSMLVEFSLDDIMVIVRAIVVCAQGQTTFMYMYLWMVFSVLYFHSRELMLFGDIWFSMMSYVFCQIYMGIIAGIEVPLYTDNINNTTDGFVRYCAYYFFISILMVRITKNSKRLRSVLSLTTALVLSPLSLHQLYQQVRYNGRETFYQDPEMHYFMAHSYMAYVIVDVLIGMVYYPEYFTFLEGWLHHIGTFLAVYYTYYITPEKRIFLCIYMIIEVSSIILGLSRVFYDVAWIRKLRKNLFYYLFVLFRIILPTLCFLYMYSHLDTSSFIIHGISTSVNLYWLLKMNT